jgi:predicted heme/steroid binding protein/uncharacterized membrane protein
MEVIWMKEFELEELHQFDGKENRPVYVAYKGKVYDVSGSRRWKGGLHMNRHHAGNNLTSDIQAAPHEPTVLERYPQVGIMKKEEGTDRELPPALSRILARAPFLRRHPHPMTIHFPIAFTFATLGFTFLYLVTGLKTFENTAFCCLGAAILFTPLAILTGFYTWWVNYGAKSIRPVRKKQCLSFLLLAVQIILFLWRWKNPILLQTLGWQSLVYSFLVLFMFLVVTVIGWFGASLTFPIEKPVTRDQ